MVIGMATKLDLAGLVVESVQMFRPTFRRVFRIQTFRGRPEAVITVVQPGFKPTTHCGVAQLFTIGETLIAMPTACIRCPVVEDY